MLQSRQWLCCLYLLLFGTYCWSKKMTPLWVAFPSSDCGLAFSFANFALGKPTFCFFLLEYFVQWSSHWVTILIFGPAGWQNRQCQRFPSFQQKPQALIWARRTRVLNIQEPVLFSSAASKTSMPCPTFSANEDNQRWPVRLARQLSHLGVRLATLLQLLRSIYIIIFHFFLVWWWELTTTTKKKEKEEVEAELDTSHHRNWSNSSNF